jgi:hypothetical protein
MAWHLGAARWNGGQELHAPEIRELSGNETRRRGGLASAQMKWKTPRRVDVSFI